MEFDGQDWDKREWFKISNKSHQVFLVEKTVVWAERVDPYAQVPSNIVWPALVRSFFFFFFADLCCKEYGFVV